MVSVALLLGLPYCPRRRLQIVGERAQKIDRSRDVILVEIPEGFGAVATLDNERSPFGDAAQIARQSIDLCKADEARRGFQPGFVGPEIVRIAVNGRLQRLVLAPAVGSPVDLVHDRPFLENACN